MPRTLVTGASGFVGPHVKRALQSQGFEVITTDLRHSDFPCNLVEAQSVQNLVAETKPDSILHLASISSVAQSHEQPRQTLENNLAAGCNLLEAVRHEASGARLLFVGSAEQYGRVKPNELPLNEAQAFRPASPYAVAKVAQEFMALQYMHSYDIDVVLTRSFNHSGPGQLDRFVLPAFARQIAEIEKNQRPPVLQVGNLDVARDFLDVRDVAQAYVRLLQDGETGEAYNVCRGEATGLRQLLDKMLSRSSHQIRVEVDPERLRPVELPVLVGNPDKLMQRTGWRPSIDLDTMLTGILDDWRNR